MKENTNDFPPQIQELLAAFEAAVIEDIYGEYWSARDLAKLLGYSGWQAFKGPIDKAKSSCADLGAPVEHHFKPINKMITIGKGGQRAQVLDAIAEEADSIAYRIRARKPGGAAIDGPPSGPDEVRP